MNHTLKNKILTVVIGCALGLLAGCASTQMSNQNEYQGFLPKPDVILVYDFAVSPDEVKQDSGISARIGEALNKEPRTVQERIIGRQVSSALAAHLVAEIRKLGLNAARTNGAQPTNGNTLAIKGQFVSIDEGNRTARLVIGFGLGRTDVRTEVQAYDISGGNKVLANSFEMNANSSSLPVGSAEFSAGVEADADRTAKSIAKQLKYFFLAQNWIGLETGAGDPNNPNQLEK
jgi:hypothetical protein